MNLNKIYDTRLNKYFLLLNNHLYDCTKSLKKGNNEDDNGSNLFLHVLNLKNKNKNISEKFGMNLNKNENLIFEFDEKQSNLLKTFEQLLLSLMILQEECFIEFSAFSIQTIFAFSPQNVSEKNLFIRYIKENQDFDISLFNLHYFEFNETEKHYKFIPNERMKISKNFITSIKKRTIKSKISKIKKQSKNSLEKLRFIFDLNNNNQFLQNITDFLSPELFFLNMNDPYYPYFTDIWKLAVTVIQLCLIKNKYKGIKKKWSSINFLFDLSSFGIKERKIEKLVKFIRIFGRISQKDFSDKIIRFSIAICLFQNSFGQRLYPDYNRSEYEVNELCKIFQNEEVVNKINNLILVNKSKKVLFETSLEKLKSNTKNIKNNLIKNNYFENENEFDKYIEEDLLVNHKNQSSPHLLYKYINDEPQLFEIPIYSEIVEIVKKELSDSGFLYISRMLSWIPEKRTQPVFPIKGLGIPDVNLVGFMYNQFIFSLNSKELILKGFETNENLKIWNSINYKDFYD